VQSGLIVPAPLIGDALQGLVHAQHLNRRTHAVHAAAFCRAGYELIVREDVGRHNALDKLAGALNRTGTAAQEGFLVLSSRVSIEMVQKGRPPRSFTMRGPAGRSRSRRRSAACRPLWRSLGSRCPTKGWCSRGPPTCKMAIVPFLRLIACRTTPAAAPHEPMGTADRSGRRALSIDAITQLKMTFRAPFMMARRKLKEDYLRQLSPRPDWSPNRRPSPTADQFGSRQSD
jgi:hypothetical protein